jgi:hypothetical protein
MNITNYFNNIPDLQVRTALQKVFAALIAELDAYKAAFNDHVHVFGKPRVFTAGGFAAKATADADIKTVANILYQGASGAMKTKTSGNIDVSAVTGYTPAALATAKQRYFLVTVNLSTNAYGITEGVDHASAAVLPATPTGHIAVGWVKVVNATGSDFTFGTTNLDTANLTVTYGDLCQDDDDAMRTSKPDASAAGFTQDTAKTFTQTLTV